MNVPDFHHWLAHPPRRTLVMGVVNVTPDSFSDGGMYLDASRAIDAAKQMIDDGADLIDIGGESTRPGAQRVLAHEQIRRVVPVIKAIAPLGITLSIDTTLAEVASAALDAGAGVVNDISAGTEDAGIAPVVASRGCPVVLMHMQGTPATMQANPTYADVVEEVRTYLLARAAAFVQAGVARSKIILDPGIGFGKTLQHNLQLLKHVPKFVETGYPILIGTSRKGFIGKILDLPDPATRVHGTAATVAWSVIHGAGIVRVHEVRAMRQTVTMLESISDFRLPIAD